MSLFHLKSEDFIRRRSKLIDSLSRGEMSKKEFLEENYKMCLQNKPFSLNNCKCFPDALYRYEYYNALAKYNRMRMQENPHRGKLSDKVLSCIRKIENYYAEKDRAILLMMSFSKDSEISAYYITTNSKNLLNVLFEIVFTKYEKVILHSKSEKIKQKLLSRGIFSDEIRESLISDYINSEY